MGTRGPVPKRDDMRRRRNKPEVELQIAPSSTPDGAPQPEPDGDWHPIALRWYESLSTSGQAFFFEPSDWAQAAYVAEAMSRNLKQARMSGQLFSAVISAASELLTTEGARRRLRIELTKAEAADVDSGLADLMEAYKAQS